MTFADYIVVGAGVTGIALAARLSEDATTTVTVLEAGGGKFHDDNLDTPANILNNLGNPEKDWAYFSAPEQHLNERSLYLPRGKGIGGSSLLNFMEVNRASSVEYDDINRLAGGNSKWSWAELLPYFIKSETFSTTEEEVAKYGNKFDPNFHGDSGPVQRTPPLWLDAVASPWMESVKACGIPYNPDPNSGDNTGVWVSTKTIDRNAVRSSAASAYYEPNQSRLNLRVITGAHVTRVLTLKKDTVVVATGVEYLKDGVVQTINASKEVILCCGSYQSPQILELSGIGDPEVLKQHDIPVVIDLPGVGNNLQEHVTATYTVKLKPGHETWENLKDADFLAKQLETYTVNRGGMFSALPSAFAFLPFKDFDNEGSIAKLVEKLPDSSTLIRTLLKEWAKNDKVPFLEVNAFDRFMPGRALEPEPGCNYMSSSVIALHPFSTSGSVHITSADPKAPPKIHMNTLDNDIDLKVLIKGYKLLRAFAQTQPLKDHIEEEISPGADLQTDEELADYIRKTLISTYHPTATVSMLPRDSGGCVDSTLKVYGTQNLRVADASIFPVSLSAHTTVTLYALAEKLADYLKSI